MSSETERVASILKRVSRGDESGDILGIHPGSKALVRIPAGGKGRTKGQNQPKSDDYLAIATEDMTMACV